eukprot:1448865-Prymnesium_polylepis.1
MHLQPRSRSSARERVQRERPCRQFVHWRFHLQLPIHKEAHLRIVVDHAIVVEFGEPLGVDWAHGREPSGLSAVVLAVPNIEVHAGDAVDVIELHDVDLARPWPVSIQAHEPPSWP